MKAGFRLLLAALLFVAFAVHPLQHEQFFTPAHKTSESRSFDCSSLHGGELPHSDLAVAAELPAYGSVHHEPSAGTVSSLQGPRDPRGPPASA